MPFEPEAAEAVRQLQKLTEAEYDRAEEAKDEVARTAWSRTCENATKLALIYACSENHENPVIGLPAVQWATAFAMHQTRRQLYLAATYVAENPFHAECLKLLRRLRESGGQMRASPAHAGHALQGRRLRPDHQHAHPARGHRAGGDSQRRPSRHRGINSHDQPAIQSGIRLSQSVTQARRIWGWAWGRTVPKRQIRPQCVTSSP